METNKLILLEHCCQHYNIEISFIDALNEFGLISITQINEDRFLSHDDLREMEKIVQFYYELGINLEGIEVIINLLHQMNVLRQELDTTKSKLKVFVSD
ncbi:MAG: MerR family transcriptional regulator [Saprospiraceae bacterium]|nr:MerR family transcriptional regulator [Saprospiraceae bacterium]